MDSIRLLHRCVLENLQLVKFEALEREDREDVGFVQDVFATLLRKAQNEMSPAVDAPFGGGTNGFFGSGKIVAAMHQGQCAVVATFNAILYHDIVLLSQRANVVQLFCIHAVGARADNQSRHHWMGKGLAIAFLKNFQRGVSITVSLQISKVTAFVPTPACVEGDALVDLLGDALMGLAVARVESCIVAEGAPTRAQSAITIRATKTGIDGKLEHRAAK